MAPTRRSSNRPSNRSTLNQSDQPRSTRDSDEETDIEVEDDGLYEVEKVMAKRYDEDGNIDYLLKWKNWDGEPTWERSTNMSCEQLVRSFEDKLARNLNDRDCPPRMSGSRAPVSPGSRGRKPLNIREQERDKRRRRI